MAADNKKSPLYKRSSTDYLFFAFEIGNNNDRHFWCTRNAFFKVFYCQKTAATLIYIFV